MEKYMAEALRLAKISMEGGDVPVGCVITDRGGNIIGRGYNRRENLHTAVAHAEIEAIDDACRAIGNWRLSGCSMFVTLEPCPMCAGAIINSRIAKLFYGAKNSVSGSCGSVINLFMERYGHEPQIVGGIFEDECALLLKKFFEMQRKK